VAIDYKDARLTEPVNAVTVLRGKLDAWLAQKCEEAGVMIMPGVRVDRVLTEGGRVVGVQAGDDELRAHVVVAADGVNSFIAQDAGLRRKPPLHHLAVGVKSVVALPRRTIEERFNLTGDEGAAVAAVGDCTLGVGGGGFLYTNIDSLSVGIVVRLDDLTAKKKVVTDIFDHFLEHRFIAPYLEGGELLEYGCHLVAEGGLDMVGEIVMDGMVVVGDAAGLTLNTGLTVRGMDLAVGSAVAAAEAIGEALDQKDTSKAVLSAYREKLFASYVGKDMKTYSRAPHFLEGPRMYKEYGELFANVLYNEFNLDTQPRKHLLKVARESLTHSHVTIRQLVRDGIAGVRAL
jgi:electron transfer flavoprotein-quinone oxidoreductase